MQRIKMIFFGSTNDSVIVLSRLSGVVCVVTQPPRPVGRKHIITPTPVETWTKENLPAGRQENIPVLTFPHQKETPWLFENEQTVTDTLAPFKADILVSACFGQKIPIAAIRAAKFGGLNVHPSLLPRWRGADPVPWAILSGDRQTGVTIVTLAEQFDEGKIIAQQKCSITKKDTSDELRTKLFKMGATLLTATLSDDLSSLTFHERPRIKSQSAKITNTSIKTLPYARRFTRDDGFIPWDMLQKAIQGIDVPNEKRPALFSSVTGHWSLVIERAWRALHPWPGLWTLFRPGIRRDYGGQAKRVKILSCHLQPTTNNSQPTTHLHLDLVQLEGKSPIDFPVFARHYLTDSSLTLTS